MNAPRKPFASTRSYKITRSLLLGLFVVALAIPSLALARDDRGERGRDDRHAHDDWRGHERYAHRYYGEPGYVYAPPVVYSPPPPVYESPGLNLVIPFNFH